MPPLAITGATGQIGGRVAARLAEQGVEQRLVVRDASRAPDLPGAEVAQAEYRDSEAMRTALEGADTLFMVSASESFDRVDEHRSAVDAAALAGVRRVVYLSFLAAAPDTTFTFGRDHFHTEEHIRASGLAYTFLRDSMYADMVPVFASAEGVIRGPGGQGRASFVAREDVSESAVGALLGDGHDGRTYELTGPEALTLDEVAGLLSAAAGREVVYREETLEEARASRAPSGAPDWEIEGWVTSYAAIAAGDLEKVTGDVRVLSGHEPMTLSAWLTRHPEALDHLRPAS